MKVLLLVSSALAAPQVPTEAASASSKISEILSAAQASPAGQKAAGDEQAMVSRAIDDTKRTMTEDVSSALAMADLQRRCVGHARKHGPQGG